MKRAVTVASVVAVLLGLLLPNLPAQAASGAPATVRGTTGARHGLVVPTDRGLVQGKSAEGTDQWLGIPYAAPPVGALRWAAPQPTPRWRGIRPTTSYGSRCAQLASGNGPRVDNEDCLYLNVYTPARARPSAAGAGHDPRRRADHRRR